MAENHIALPVLQLPCPGPGLDVMHVMTDNRNKLCRRRGVMNGVIMCSFSVYAEQTLC